MALDDGRQAAELLFVEHEVLAAGVLRHQVVRGLAHQPDFIRSGQSRPAMVRETGRQLLPQQHCYLYGKGKSLFNVKGHFAAAAGAGVFLRGIAESVADADVVHDQAAGLVAEHGGHAVDGLDEVVAAHHLVHVERVQRGVVEAGEPHVAHDHELERVVGVLEAALHFLHLLLGAHVRVPGGRVFGDVGGHDHGHLGAAGQNCLNLDS